MSSFFPVFLTYPLSPISYGIDNVKTLRKIDKEGIWNHADNIPPFHCAIEANKIWQEVSGLPVKSSQVNMKENKDNLELLYIFWGFHEGHPPLDFFYGF